MWRTSQNNCGGKGKITFLRKTKKKNRVRLKETGLHAWLLCSNMAFVSGWAKLYPSLYPQSDCCICQHIPEEMPNTHTDTNTLTKSSELPVHTCSYKPQKLSHRHNLERSKEIRAVGQGGVHSASSANLLFLHLSRSPGIITHILDIALQFPPWKKQRGRVLLSGMYI